MAISTRFSVAIHILSMIELNPNQPMTSEYMAGSIGTNPVVVRRIMSVLKKQQLIYSSPGLANCYLLKNPREISLLEVYQAVEPTSKLLAIHQTSNPLCGVGANIEQALDTAFSRAQQKMEAELSHITLFDITQSIQAKISK